MPYNFERRKFGLVAQIELLIGEDVKIGTAQQQGSISIFGIGADIVQTKDIEEPRVKATARIVAFVDQDNNVSAHDPTIEYMGKSVIHANELKLKWIFSRLNSNEFVPLEVGTLLGSTYAVDVVFDPTGFMRHTAIFGQSGSGKSFSFGIIVEELLAKTNARVLVLDPNSDYEKFASLRTLGKIREFSNRKYLFGDHHAFTERWKEISNKFMQFFSGHALPADKRKLSLSFSDLSRRNQADLLGLNPISDREEFSSFREVLETLGENFTLTKLIEALSKSPSVEKVRLLYRIKNREIDKMSLWGEESSVALLLNGNWNFASIDLRHVSSMERSLAAATILESVYRDIIKTKRVTFLVVDEAHNFCPSVPWEDYQDAPREIIEEIAAEGRKYGAFLMLSTQSPSKLSEQALSQCDNVILMKMTSASEVQALQKVVRDAGPRLSQSAFNLGKGEAICMGNIARAETGVKFDLRKTEPGGEDIGKQWARRKKVRIRVPIVGL